MKFPFFTQLDTMDCGPTCLRIIARFYGKEYPLQFLRSKSHTNREGVSMLGISDAAESIGFRTLGVKLTWEQLRDEVPMPCIVHWNQNHFVVVYKIKSRIGKPDTVFVSDPGCGLLKYNRHQFTKCWYSIFDGTSSMGTALLLEPTPEFYKNSLKQDKSSKLGNMWEYLRPYKRFILQLFFSMITASLISLIFPFITQSVVDVGIGGGNVNFILMALIAQMMLTFGQTANELIRNWLMLHITTRVSIKIISDFLGKLMRLPISFFDVKMVGDIMQRIGDNNKIQSFLTGSLLSVIFSSVTFVIYVVIMTLYNVKILLIFLLGSLLYALWVILFMKKRRELNYKQFQQASANQSSIVQLVNGMQEIKLNNCEKQKRWEWERLQAKLYKISVKSLTLSQSQQVGGTFIDQLKNVLISFIAADAVVSGNMTIGMMVAMQYILGQLNAPISQFIGFIQDAQDAKISLERLNEIHNTEDEEPVSSTRDVNIPKHSDIEIVNVGFQYSGPNSEWVLKNINLTIKADKITAIVGTSGSGKTTLLKLLLGFYAPVTGDVTIGGRRLDSYNASSWRQHLGVVMQEGYIFSDTIENNIGVIDEVPDINRVKEAVLTANVKDLIDSLPLGYNTKIGVDGQGLSAGQKQRLLIARAVYKKPDYIFFDEATNALDANNERTIMENLNRFFQGRTVVVVAHRLSTVKNADVIVVIDKGVIAEQGNHDELIAKRGKYYNLVKDQLELGG